MSPKASTATRKTPAKAKGKTASRKPKAKASWADVMKQALEKKQPAGGFPEQPKPRDSGIQKVKRNAF